MKTKNKILILISCFSFILLAGTAFGIENNLLPVFSNESAEGSDLNPQVYWILLLFMIAVAFYVYYVWRDYEKDDDFLAKKY